MNSIPVGGTNNGTQVAGVADVVQHKSKLIHRQPGRHIGFHFDDRDGRLIGLKRPGVGQLPFGGRNDLRKSRHRSIGSTTIILKEARGSGDHRYLKIRVQKFRYAPGSFHDKALFLLSVFL